MSGNFEKVMAGLEGLYEELSGDSRVNIDDRSGEDVQEFIQKAGCVIGLLGNAVSNALSDGRFVVGTNDGPTDEEFAAMDAVRAGGAVSAEAAR